MTDYKSLCAELADRLQRAITSSKADRFYAEDRDALDRARAALAESEADRKTTDYRRGREDGMAEGYLRGEADARAALAEPVSDCPACEGSPAASNSPCAVCAALAEGAGVGLSDGTIPACLFTLAMKALREARDPVAEWNLYEGATLADGDGQSIKQQPPTTKAPSAWLYEYVGPGFERFPSSLIARTEVEAPDADHWRPVQPLFCAALADGAGAGPSDEELLKTYGKARREFCYEGPTDDWPRREERASTVAGLRAVLARYGTTHPQAPIPVAERLPTEADCDAEGRCWWWMHLEDGRSAWLLRPLLLVPSLAAVALPKRTHWLPAAAIPLPE